MLFRSTPPTTSTQGYTTYTCTVCGDSYVDDYKNMLPSGDSELKLNGAALMLQADLTLNIKVKDAVYGANAYSNFRLEVYMFDADSGEKRTVVYTEEDLNAAALSGGIRTLSFNGISPRKMNDTIYLDLYGTYEGVEYCKSMTYSIASYCYNQLGKSTIKPAFATLLVDLLNFGASHQVYGEYNLENLVTNNLTEAQKAYASTYELKLTNKLKADYAVIENPTAAFKGASLYLANKVEISYAIDIEDLTDVSLHVLYPASDGTIVEAVLGRDAFVKDTDPKKPIRYNVRFDGLMAKQMSEDVIATVYRGDTPISNTALYSIESYAASQIPKTTNVNMKNMLIMMMYYGNSAAAYFG